MFVFVQIYLICGNRLCKHVTFEIVHVFIIFIARFVWGTNIFPLQDFIFIISEPFPQMANNFRLDSITWLIWSA